MTATIAGLHIPEVPTRTLAEAGAALAARPHVRRGVSPVHGQVRLLLVDDHVVLRSALKFMLQRVAPDITIVGEASSGNEAVTVAQRLLPDVILMDLDMPNGDGAEATRALATLAPQCKVLIFSMHSEEECLLRVLDAGARGYVRKDADDHDLVDGIHVVAAGDFYVRPSVARRLAASVVERVDQEHELLEQYERLSNREQSVLRLTAIGYNGPEIGSQLGITAKTVDTYKQRIEEKLGIAHRTGYVRFALNAGLLSR